MSGKIDAMMRHAAVVIVGNEYPANRAGAVAPTKKKLSRA